MWFRKRYLQLSGIQGSNAKMYEKSACGRPKSLQMRGVISILEKQIRSFFKKVSTLEFIC